MSSRRAFPCDLHVLLNAIIVPMIVALFMSFLFPVINWFRHPSATEWLLVLETATLSAAAGVGLLFLAKLPQYRAGVWMRAGWRHLPRLHQRLYWSAFVLMVPATTILLALIPAAKRLC